MNESSHVCILPGPPGSWLTGHRARRAQGELCWPVDPSRSGGSQDGAPQPGEVTQHGLNKQARQSPRTRALLKPGKSSVRETGQDVHGMTANSNQKQQHPKSQYTEN